MVDLTGLSIWILAIVLMDWDGVVELVQLQGMEHMYGIIPCGRGFVGCC